MSTNHQDIPWLEASFFENRRNFPLDELMKYEDQHIAWSWDGTRIVASAPDEEELYRKLREGGFDLSRVVLSYVPPS